MFETLKPLDEDQLDAGADALERDGRIDVLIDPSGVMMAFFACRGHSLDLLAVHEVDGQVVPFPMTPLQHSVLVVWSRQAVPALTARWRERHPVSCRQAAPRFLQ